MPRIYVDFESLKEARKAVEALKGMGYPDAHLDAVDRLFDEYAQELTDGGIPAGPSISAMTRPPRNKISGLAKGPVMQVDPMITGMGGLSEIGALNTRLRVTVGLEKVNEIKNMLKGMGGVV